MAKISGRAELKVECLLVLTEVEMRALDALVGYGDDAFLKVFYEKLGRAYLQPHEAGVRSLFKAVREQTTHVLRKADEARKVWDGTHEAVYKDHSRT